MADTRMLILDQARDLFSEEGLQAFSMRRVAERSKLTVSALYRHFDDKDALLAEVLEASFGTFAGYLMRSLDAETPLERFRSTAHRYFDFGREHPRDYALMFMTNCADLGFDKLGDETRERLGSSFRFLVNRIEECLEAGVFKPADPEKLAVIVWSQTHGMMSLYLVGQLGPLAEGEFEKLVDRSIDALIDGLKA